MREWDQIYRKERIFIIDPTVEWNPQMGIGYYYLDRIFALNNFNTPLTIISAPHPLDVYLDGQFINEVYEGDIIFPTSLNQRLELKIPDWIFNYPYIPAGDESLYIGYYPMYDEFQKKFIRPFIFKKGILNVKHINPFMIHFKVIQFSTLTTNQEKYIYIKPKGFNELVEKTIVENNSSIGIDLAVYTEYGEDTLFLLIEALENTSILGGNIYENKNSTILNPKEGLWIDVGHLGNIGNQARLNIFFQFKK